jgi:hypothetical protein
MTDKELIRKGSTRLRWALAGALLFAVPVLASGQSGEPYPDSTAPSADADVTAPITDERASYSYLRTLEGSATVAAAGQGIGEALETNQPLLTGDRVRVDTSSRLELALSDRNRLFLAADSDLVLERLAFSGDRQERVTVLRLTGGELLLAVADEALGDELPRVLTANATVYIHEPGEYRVETGFGSDGAGWTRVVTRRGYAEVVTDRGSSVLRTDESIVALGDREASLEISAADAPDALERWSGVVTGRTERASRSARYVEPHLADDAAPLDESGDWIEVENVSYWRPYVSDGWRPYWQGRWSWTPSGYTWISYEPWGWVPYHYGRWCSLPGYGWAWRPGALYSPAWVYWNWTSGYAGWVPIGYYSHFYNPWYSGGFRYGVYGWAGGGWGLYSDWNFAPVHCFRDRRFRGHMRRGRDMERESGHHEPPRGLLTTDTRDFRPEHLDRTDRTEDLLHRIGRRHQPRTGGDLPDMTDFVGRKGKLPTEVAKVVVPPAGRERGVIRDIDRVAKVAETPTWKQKEIAANDDKTDRRPGTGAGVKEPPVYGAAGTGKGGRENPGATSGLVLDKGRGRAPEEAGRSKTAVDSRGTVAKGSAGDRGASGGGVQAGAPGRAGATDKGAVSGNEGALGRSETPRATTKAPTGKWEEPSDPGRSKGSAPAADDRQLWKSRGGESAPVQRVVGSVRRPSPGGEPGAKDPAGSGGGRDAAQATPGTVGSTKGTPSNRGSSGYATPGGPVREPAYRSPSTGKDPASGNGSTKSSPTQSYGGTGSSPRYAPEGKPSQRAPSGAQGTKTYEPSVRSQPAPRSQPTTAYPPAVRSQPTQGSRDYPPAVKSQPSPGNHGGAKSQPATRSQPSGRGSSSAPPSGRSSSASGSKGSSSSGKNSPPPPEKKDDGGR